MTEVGRPSKFSQALLDEICERLSQGEPMAAICRDEHMPAARTVRDWGSENTAISAAIAPALARAREIGFDAIADDCLTIVDNVDEEPASRRVRAETRLKLLAKWDPKRYGDKLLLETKNDTSAMTSAELEEELATLRRRNQA